MKRSRSGTFPASDPVGRRLKIGGPGRPTNTWMTVVGVVGDMSYSGLDAPPEPAVYLPFRQTTSNRGESQSTASRLIRLTSGSFPGSPFRTWHKLLELFVPVLDDVHLPDSCG